MKVIVICEGLGGGGAVANVAWQQALGLSHRQSVCLISDGLSPERRQQLTNSRENLRLRLLRTPSFSALRRFSHLPRQLAWILLALAAVGRELQGGCTPVICHSHPLAAAVSWRYGPRVRLIMVSHGDIFHRPAGSYDPAITWLYRLTTPVAHRRAAVSVALSPVMAERIQAHGVPPERIALIPNGLDPAEIGLQEPVSTPAEHWQQRPLRLLFVGRLDPVKGVDVLLEAVALGKKNGLEAELIIVGTSTEARLALLHRLAKALEIEQEIHWVGAVPRKALAEHYNRCHAVVVPSLDDPLPTVVLEAMACGRAVIGSDVGGINFMISENKTGLLAQPRNHRKLAKALLKIDISRCWLITASREATKRSKEFTWEATTKKLRDILQNPS